MRCQGASDAGGQDLRPISKAETLENELCEANVTVTYAQEGDRWDKRKEQ
jgi:hypothetical protein